MKSQRTPKEILVIAAIVVLALIFLCAGSVLAYKMNAPAQAASLPVMPTYIYLTSTPVSSSAKMSSSPTITVTPTKTTQPWNKPEPLSAVPLANTTIPYESLISVSNCRNILYPVKRGQVWNYQARANSHSGNVRMVIISNRDSRGLVEVGNQLGTLSGSAYVTCDRDLILNSLVLNAKALFGNALNGTVKADYLGGVLAPTESVFTKNNWALSWSTSYRISGSGSINYHGYHFTLVLDPFDMRMTCQTLASGAAAFETVTVSAGRFYALKVLCTMQGQGMGTLNGIPVTGSFSAQSTQWFAPYIGLVKMQSDNVNIKIFGFTIPIGTSGLTEQMALLNFVQSR